VLGLMMAGEVPASVPTPTTAGGRTA
jgi:hypothetical protein